MTANVQIVWPVVLMTTFMVMQPFNSSKVMWVGLTQPEVMESVGGLGIQQTWESAKDSVEILIVGAIIYNSTLY